MKSIKSKKIMTITLLTISALIITGCQPAIDQTGAEALTISDEDWVKGANSPKVAIIEYSDFQCPACRQTFPLLKQASQEFPNDLAIAYRHFPLEQHLQAIPAARASEAAGMQGKFWEMHDMIFENQDEWANSAAAKDIFQGYAEDLGLDIAKYEEDYAARSTLKKIQTTRQHDQILPITGTPTLFLNGQKVSVGSYESLKEAIQEAIDQPAEESPLEVEVNTTPVEQPL